MGLDNPLHIAFLVVILLLVFGARRLPEIGRSLGSGLREFKQSISGETSQPALTAGSQQTPAQPPQQAPPQQTPAQQAPAQPSQQTPAQQPQQTPPQQAPAQPSQQAPPQQAPPQPSQQAPAQQPVPADPAGGQSFEQSEQTQA